MKKKQPPNSVAVLGSRQGEKQERLGGMKKEKHERPRRTKNSGFGSRPDGEGLEFLIGLGYLTSLRYCISLRDPVQSLYQASDW